MDDFLVGLILGAAIFGAVTACVTGGIVSGNNQKAAIEHGCAQYSPTTGEFEWKGDEAR